MAFGVFNVPFLMAFGVHNGVYSSVVSDPGMSSSSIDILFLVFIVTVSSF